MNGTREALLHQQTDRRVIPERKPDPSRVVCGMLDRRKQRLCNCIRRQVLDQDEHVEFGQQSALPRERSCACTTEQLDNMDPSLEYLKDRKRGVDLRWIFSRRCSRTKQQLDPVRSMALFASNQRSCLLAFRPIGFVETGWVCKMVQRMVLAAKRTLFWRLLLPHSKEQLLCKSIRMRIHAKSQIALCIVRAQLKATSRVCWNGNSQDKVKAHLTRIHFTDVRCITVRTRRCLELCLGCFVCSVVDSSRRVRGGYSPTDSLDLVLLRKRVQRTLTNTLGRIRTERNVRRCQIFQPHPLFTCQH